MLTINKLVPQGRGLAPSLLKRAAQVELPWDVRCKSRFDATDTDGRTLGVFLPRGSAVRGGDVLVVEDGTLLRVTAAAETVLVVRACPEHGSPYDLLRAAYHLGNRHVPLELQPDRLLLEPDHVLAEMLRTMHLSVSEEQSAFEPESGAYTAADGGHSHAAPARGKPLGIAVKAEPHVHGPGCGHDHGHGGHDH